MRSEPLASVRDGGRGERHGRRGLVARAVQHRVAVLAAILAAKCGCAGPQSEQLSCEDVLPAGSVDFGSIQALVLRPPRGKGCLGSSCHSSSAQSAGIRLDDPELVYEEFSTRPELFYAALAAGEMPRMGRPWSAADLRAFRSWYCDGAFPP